MRNSLAAIESIILLETVRCLETKGHSSVAPLCSSSLFRILASDYFTEVATEQPIPIQKN